MLPWRLYYILRNRNDIFFAICQVTKMVPKNHVEDLLTYYTIVQGYVVIQAR